MFHQHIKSKILPVLIVILFFVFVYAPVNTRAQSLYKLNSSAPPPPGGRGSTTTATQNDGDNISIIWVILGVTAGLVLFYKFVIQKGDDKKAVGDTTSTSSNMLRRIGNYPSLVKKVKNEDSQLPFRLYMGIRRDDPVYNNKTYILGVSFNL